MNTIADLRKAWFKAEKHLCKQHRIGDPLVAGFDGEPADDLMTRRFDRIAQQLGFKDAAAADRILSDTE